MQRRAFIATTLTAAAGLAVASRTDAAPETTLENVVFTQGDPGHWKSLEEIHVPVVTVSGTTMTVHTPHPMTEAHYIVSHTIVLEGGKFLSRKTFAWNDQPTSQHTLPANYKGRVTVTSTCNRHDWWLKEMTV